MLIRMVFQRIYQISLLYVNLGLDQKVNRGMMMDVVNGHGLTVIHKDLVLVQVDNSNKYVSVLPVRLIETLVVHSIVQLNKNQI